MSTMHQRAATQVDAWLTASATSDGKPTPSGPAFISDDGTTATIAGPSRRARTERTTP